MGSHLLTHHTMGQAKQRGTFQQRVELAKARNAQLEDLIAQKPNSGIAAVHRKLDGRTQRLATRLVACGVLSIAGKPV